MPLEKKTKKKVAGNLSGFDLGAMVELLWAGLCALPAPCFVVWLVTNAVRCGRMRGRGVLGHALKGVGLARVRERSDVAACRRTVTDRCGCEGPLRLREPQPRAVRGDTQWTPRTHSSG
jgi:hypothetical protein